MAEQAPTNARGESHCAQAARNSLPTAPGPHPRKKRSFRSMYRQTWRRMGGNLPEARSQ